MMSVIETTQDVTKSWLQGEVGQNDVQMDAAKDEEGQHGKEHDEKIKPGGENIDIDHDAQEMVITSLRTQVQDLFSQVNQLNNKLVQSYDRVSDLEDSLHVTTTNLHLSNQKIDRLELEKSQHLSQVTSGLLVERNHVTAELTRLMERATEEAAQRGQAENAKDRIERELEELSASLFGEANGMVEEARIARSLSERKVEEAEGRLKEAEEAVRIMQSQMQTLMQEKEDVERKPDTMTLNSAVGVAEKLMKRHLAYNEFLAFLAHLRHLHASNPTGIPPTMASLLQSPFLSRLLNEDADPTLRLDLAPSLNWLSRRSVLTAIYTGQLSVEPISAVSLFTLSVESPLITIAGMVASNLNITANLEDLEINIPCALCGTSIFPVDTNSRSNSQSIGTQPYLSPNFASVLVPMSSQTTWSATAGSFFRKPSNPLTRALSSTSPANGASLNGLSSTSLNSASSYLTTTAPSTHPIAKSKHSSFNAHITPQTQIHIFRLASLPSSSSSALSSFSLPLSKSSSQPVSPLKASSSTSGSASSSRPPSSASLASSSTVASSQPTTFYPLCTSGWCLARLRATCTLWSFIRTGIVEKIWDEEVLLPTPPNFSPAQPALSGSTATATLAPVATLSRSRVDQSQQGKPPPVPPRRRGLWGIASALGERAASWSDGVGKEKRENKESSFQPPSKEKSLPGGVENVAAALEGGLSKDSHAEAALNSSSLPPPLPKRNANRSLNNRKEIDSITPVESSSQPTLTGTTDSNLIRTPPSSPVRTSLPAKSTHLRNSSLSQAVNVPLPDSRAGTPSSLPDVKINTHISNTTPTPSRTASPAPPVPRRAAARSKGGVGVVNMPSDGTRVDEKQKEDQLGHTVAEGVKTFPEMLANEEAAVEGDKKETQGEPAKLGSDLSERNVVEIKTIPADQEKLEALVSESGESNISTSGMNGIIKTAEAEKERKIGLPLLEEMSLPDARHEGQSSEQSLPTTGTAPRDVTDESEFVGTSSWEEKTWRELVRIRKDMFYARLGSLNP